MTDETKYGTAKAVGTATNYAREDHTHGSHSYAVPSGRWFHIGGNLTTQALTLNQMVLYPIRVPKQALQSIALEVTTLGASGLLRVGFYGMTSTGAPDLAGGPLLDAGTQSSATTGVKTWTISWTPSAEEIYLAVVAQTAGCTVRAVTTPISWSQLLLLGTGESPTTNANKFAQAVASVTGALPSSGTPTTTSVFPPKIWLQAT